MKPFSRRLHDAYTGVGSLLGLPLAKAGDMDLPSEVTCHRTRTAGEITLDNTLECQIYPNNDGTVASFNWPQTRLYEIEDALITGDQGCVFLPDGRCLYVCPSLKNIPDRKLRRPLIGLADYLDFPVVHLTGRDHENHGHFLLQHLPRLMAWENHGIIPKDAKILVAPGHKKWQSRYLNLLGYPPDRIIEGSPGTLRVKRLLYCPFLYGNKYLSDPLYYSMLQKAFRASGSCRVSSSTTALFITRTKAPDRRLLNESEVVNELRLFFPDLLVVDLAQYSLEEQISLCRSASVIIGPQGQGMSVLFFQHNGLGIILEYGEKPLPAGWCATFRDVSLMFGNRTVRFYSGQPLQSDGNWIYPLIKLRADLNKLFSLVQLPASSTLPKPPLTT
jgi:hypothetical protein